MALSVDVVVSAGDELEVRAGSMEHCDYTSYSGSDPDSTRWMRVTVLRVHEEDGACDITSWRKGSPVMLHVSRERLRLPKPWGEKPVMKERTI